MVMVEYSFEIFSSLIHDHIFIVLLYLYYWVLLRTYQKRVVRVKVTLEDEEVKW